MNERRWVLLGAAVASVLGACAGFQVYRVSRLDLPHRAVKLKNGLRVVIQPDPTTASAWIHLRYNVGAAQDPKAKKGLAHVIEHLAFRMGDKLIAAPAEAVAPLAPAAPGSVDQAGSAAPAEATADEAREVEVVTRIEHDSNAHTGLDETVYYRAVSVPDLRAALVDFAGAMGDFTSEIDEAVLEAERNVVRNERRSRNESEPRGRWFLDLYERLFPIDHPYQGQAVIGSHDSLNRIDLADVSDFLKRHYHPGNAILSISGPVQAEAVLPMVIELFGDKPGGPPSVLTIPAWKPTHRQEVIELVDAREAMVTVAWPIGPRDSVEARGLAVVNNAAGGWFDYRLVANRGWAYWAWSDVWGDEHESLFIVQALARDPGDVSAIVDKILEIASIMPSYVDDGDFGRSVSRRVYRSLSSVTTPDERGEALAEFFARDGQPIGWLTEMNAWDNLDRAAATSAAQRLLTEERAFVLIHTPPKGRGKSGGSTPSLSANASRQAGGVLDQQRKRDRPRDYRIELPFADYQHWAVGSAAKWEEGREVRLRNGMPCRIAQVGSVPLMTIALGARGGRLSEPADVLGVGDLMFSVMGLSGRADRERSWRSGFGWSWDVDDEWLTLSAGFPSFYADLGGELLAEVAFSPQMSNSDLADERNAKLQRLGEVENNVDTLAARAFWKARGLADLSPVVTQRTVEAIGLGDVGAMHSRSLGEGELVCAAAGPLPIAETQRILEDTFGGVALATRSASNKGAPPPAAVGLVEVNVPGASQSKVLLAVDGAGWGSWEEELVADGVAELLAERARHIRRAMGATYGVNAHNIAFRDVGALWLSTKVEAAQTAAVVDEALRVWDELRQHTITDGEFDYVRRVLMSRGVGDRNSAHAMANYQVGLLLRGQSMDHPRRYVERAAALTKAELQAALVARLSARPMVVVAGKPLPKSHQARDGLRAVRYTVAELL